MSVQIDVVTGGSWLTWDNSDFTWGQRPSTSWENSIDGDKYHLTASDTIGMLDDSAGDVTKNELASLAIADSCSTSSQFKRKLAEHLQVYIRTHREVSVKAVQSLSVTEHKAFDIKQLIRRSVVFAEALRKTKTYQRILQELLMLTEVSKKRATIKNSGSFSIGDDMLHHANAVISDIIIGTEEVGADIPPGYTDFMRFLPGDYAYTKALVKLALEADMTADRPMVDTWTYNVDLPDIVKRGNATLAAENTTITFDSRFYQIPEVTITMRAASGAVPIPNITSVTRDSFNVELRNSSGQLVAGTISWQAIGC